MAELGTVFVDVRGDYSGLQTQTKSSMLGVAGKAAGIFAAAFAAHKIFDFGKQALDEANDLNESANAVAKTFTGEALTSVQQFGAQSAQTMGLATSDFNQFAVQFAGFAEKIDPSNVGGVIEDVGTRVADFASVMNLEVGEAGSEFASIMAGSSEVARKYGLDVSDAAVTQFALSEGLAASKAEMTEADKVQARYGILMQSTEKWAGDFADTSDQMANATRIAKAEFANAKAELGQSLLPVMSEVVAMVRTHLIPLVTKLSPVFVAVGQAITQLLPPVIELVNRLIPIVEKIIPPLVTILGQVLDAFLALVAPILELVLVALDPLIDIVLLLAEDIIAALMPAILSFSEVTTALTPLLMLLMELLGPIVDIVGMLAQILGGVLKAAVESVASWIGKLTDKLRPLIEFLKNLFEDMAGALEDVLPGVIDWFANLPGIILDAIGNAASWLIDVGTDMIQGLIDGIKSMGGKIIDTIKRWVTDKIPGFVKDVFGIKSPSKLFKGFGMAISEGLAVGIIGGSGQVDQAMNSLLPNLSLQGSGFSLAGSGVGALPPVTINTINAGQQLARDVGQEMAWQKRTRGI